MDRYCFIRLDQPLRLLFLSSEELEVMMKTNKLCSHFFYSVSLPDILFDQPTNTWVGLTFGVVEEDYQSILLMCQRLNNNIIRLNRIASSEDAKIYRNEGGVDLEIIWSKYEKLAIAPAQLCEIRWVFLDGPDVPLGERAIGITIFQVDTVMSDNGFPHLHLPQLF